MKNKSPKNIRANIDLFLSSSVDTNLNINRINYVHLLKSESPEISFKRILTISNITVKDLKTAALAFISQCERYMLTTPGANIRMTN